ncbi:TPA: alpha-amylase [Corynebacterium striatum]|nr:alpha-amylase [Corynebacterium striatum]HAT6592425.1 alpha-amylase [Corynebacterium striatum]
MSAFDHAVWWHVYPLTACGAPIREEHTSAPRLKRLEAWMDYVVELGCNGLLLGPIFASMSHGYDTVDYYRLDPRLGTDDEWDAFVDAAHSRGLRIMLDGVFNHVGAQHPLAAHPTEDNAGMVQESGWEGHEQLRELNHADPRVADMVVDIMCHWLGKGADAWRLDVSYAVPSEFWATVTERVREHFPNVAFLGEVLHGDFAAIGRAGHLDAVTAYELWKGTWSSIHDVNFWELAHALERHAGFSSTMTMQTFVGNHDVNRIASQVGDAGAVLAATILFTVPGMPSVYYGDEQAFRGEKAEGFAADDPIRPPLPENPAELAELGWWLYHLYQELIALRRRNDWLTHALLEVRDKANESITYAVTTPEHECLVSLHAGDHHAATVTIDGHTEFEWRG